MAKKKTSKQLVQAVYPNASEEGYGFTRILYYTIWNKPFGRKQLGCGRTRAEAWKNAWKNIKAVKQL